MAINEKATRSSHVKSYQEVEPEQVEDFIYSEMKDMGQFYDVCELSGHKDPEYYGVWLGNIFRAMRVMLLEYA